MSVFSTGKTIHVLNKNEHAIDMAAPVHDQLGDVNGLADDPSSVKMRTNVLLLGDHIGDLGMSDGLNYKTRISVGFLWVTVSPFKSKKAMPGSLCSQLYYYSEPVVLACSWYGRQNFDFSFLKRIKMCFILDKMGKC